jgi:dipeptidyl aminopeptidase/acylaminoacyl peptidase
VAAWDSTIGPLTSCNPVSRTLVRRSRWARAGTVASAPPAVWTPTTARQLTRGGFDSEPVFSPDDRRIVFARMTRDAEVADVAIYVVRTDGSGLRQVVPSTFDLEHPDWSADGRWIAFNIAPTTPNQTVMAVHPNGSGLRVIRRSDTALSCSSRCDPSTAASVADTLSSSAVTSKQGEVCGIGLVREC